MPEGTAFDQATYRITIPDPGKANGYDRKFCKGTVLKIVDESFGPPGVYVVGVASATYASDVVTLVIGGSYLGYLYEPQSYSYLTLTKALVRQITIPGTYNLYSISPYDDGPSWHQPCQMDVFALDLRGGTPLIETNNQLIIFEPLHSVWANGTDQYWWGQDLDPGVIKSYCSGIQWETGGDVTAAFWYIPTFWRYL